MNSQYLPLILRDSDHECKKAFHNVAWGLDCQVETTRLNFVTEDAARHFLDDLLIYIRFRYSVVEAVKDVCKQEGKSVLLPITVFERLETMRDLIDLAE